MCAHQRDARGGSIGEGVFEFERNATNNADEFQRSERAGIDMSRPACDIVSRLSPLDLTGVPSALRTTWISHGIGLCIGSAGDSVGLIQR
ncbi:hypothetical protein DPEC_G00261810 [Dallia pectoralis]|uniref:Uncharacterized protein n=1 Tax=Dallia pectoralis TaxID=75939 RepID=A0ACC2FRK9_DALPE|nr:hypothetical protein DPEC_G00261810 [Dallia pectoralis]